MTTVEKSSKEAGSRYDKLETVIQCEVYTRFKSDCTKRLIQQCVRVKQVSHNVSNFESILK